MDNLQRETLNRIIPATLSPVDCQKCKAGLAYARANGFESECRAMILKKRLEWLTWWTITQRKWQAHTRNPNKAMHHDSISLREKYVRC